MNIINKKHSVLLACFLSLTAVNAQTDTTDAADAAKIVTTVSLGTTMAGRKFFAQIKGADAATIKNRQAFVQALASEPKLLGKIQSMLAAISILEKQIAAATDATKERKANVMKLLFLTSELKHLITSSPSVKEACSKATSLIERIDDLDSGETFRQQVLKTPQTAAAFYGEIDVYATSAALLASQVCKLIAESKNEAINPASIEQMNCMSPEELDEALLQAEELANDPHFEELVKNPDFQENLIQEIEASKNEAINPAPAA